MELRQYQIDVVEACRIAIRSGAKRLLLEAPTGSGKTVIASHIIENAADKGKRILFLAHRRELVHQCADKLRAFGVDHGIIMAGEFLQYEFEVQVASIDTLRVRALNAGAIPLPKADVIFVDEAHRSLAPTYIKLMDEYPDAVVIGMSATPCRTDGKGLGDIYQTMVHCPGVRELTEAGYLVPITYYAPTVPDLTGVKINRGDYDPRQLEKAMDKRQLVGDVVSHWFRLGRDRPTIVFASGVQHSIHLRDEFCKAGVSACHVDGEMSRAAREDAINGLRDGTYQVVTNCMVLTEGFDMPELSCNILARPTKSLGLYLQMAGRTLRPADGKDDCLLIDHSGNVYQHGFVDDPRLWTLKESPHLNMDHVRQKEERVAKTITCVECGHVYERQLICPKCGHTPQKKGRYIETRHGELTRLDKNKRRTAKKKVYSPTDRRRWYNMLRFHAAEKEYKPGWANWKFKEKFGDFPPEKWVRDGHIEPPSEEVKAYIRHLNIKAAKRREKEAHRAQINR